jgi:hypothetical protein
MNRRRHANVIQIAPIATWVLLALFACAGGLYFVDCKNQAHKRGEKLKVLEKELVELRNGNDVVRNRIALLSSPNVLRKLRATDKNFLADYVEITHDRVVVVTETPAGANDLRPVSNEHR